MIDTQLMYIADTVTPQQADWQSWLQHPFFFGRLQWAGDELKSVGLNKAYRMSLQRLYSHFGNEAPLVHAALHPDGHFRSVLCDIHIVSKAIAKLIKTASPGNYDNRSLGCRLAKCQDIDDRVLKTIKDEYSSWTLEQLCPHYKVLLEVSSEAIICRRELAEAPAKPAQVARKRRPGRSL